MYFFLISGKLKIKPRSDKILCTFHNLLNLISGQEIKQKWEQLQAEDTWTSELSSPCMFILQTAVTSAHRRPISKPTPWMTNVYSVKPGQLFLTRLLIVWFPYWLLHLSYPPHWMLSKCWVCPLYKRKNIKIRITFFYLNW